MMFLICLPSLLTSQDLQKQRGGKKGTATLKVESQQILISIDYLRGKDGKATEDMRERSGERSVLKKSIL